MTVLARWVALLLRTVLGLCALALVLAALYVSLGRQLVPLVAEYRAEIEAKAQAAVDMPVHIGSLEGRWSGFAPVLLAHDVMVGSGANALRLDRVRAVPDLWASLLAREVRIAHLELNGLKISLKEAEDGSWALEGLPVQNDQPLDAQQLFNRSQMIQQLSVLDSQVTLQPLDHAPLTLTYVGLNLKTGASRQRLDARLTLPDGQPAEQGKPHQVLFRITDDSVNKASVLLQGRVRYPNGEVEDFALNEPGLTPRQLQLHNRGHGSYILDVSAYGSMQDGREFMLNLPEISFVVNRPVFEAPVLEELPQSIKDEIAAEQAEPEPEFPWGLVISANLFILIGGGFAIWFVMTDRKPADLMFWRKKAPAQATAATTDSPTGNVAEKNGANAQKNNDMDDILDLTLPDD